ncbi:glycosyltransferase family 2 protein [Anaerobium acetethylicum]|uniref:Glycosyltransferase involved in cell wall bisynthesis n=1 Tax=Anaerobium acetethylicum TaxID=1619234 RepID=A0A1D3TRA5_9FIRM|nr:glycosyltransferase family 2 protein [Anaerobium acetethylicum]SCP96226.1 Glycosyltransferase involved in cell wall bisynthesis [Anaerobium acetethylicum]
MNKPFISIVIPVYNKSLYLSDFFECCEQIDSGIDIEIIFVDDGSTDTSWNLLLDYAKKNKRIKIFHQENAGAGYARNLGIEKSQGKYITFIDSDDLFNVGCIQKIIEKLTYSNTDILFLKFKNFNGDKIFDTYYSSDYEYDYLLRTSPAPWGRFFRKKFLIDNNIKFNNARTGEDMYFNCLAQCYFPRNDIFEETFIYYRIAENSLSTTIDKKPLAICESFNILIETLKERNLFDTFIQKNLSRYCLKYIIDDLSKVNFTNKKKLMRAYQSLLRMFGNTDTAKSCLFGKRYVMLHKLISNNKIMSALTYLQLLKIKEKLTCTN